MCTINENYRLTCFDSKNTDDPRIFISSNHPIKDRKRKPIQSRIAWVNVAVRLTSFRETGEEGEPTERGIDPSGPFTNTRDGDVNEHKAVKYCISVNCAHVCHSLVQGGD